MKEFWKMQKKHIKEKSFPQTFRDIMFNIMLLVYSYILNVYVYF